MTRKSVRTRGLMLLAASMAFAACAPLPTADSDPKPTTTSKKKASPSPSASASTAASASPSTAASASPSVSPSPSASPSVSPSPSPSASASASPSPSPSPTPSPLALAADEAGGRVYDEKGVLLTSGKVRMVSLNPLNGFDKTADIVNGVWKIPGVPVGVNMAVTATREGWTSRQRVKTLAGNSGLEVNFGGPTTTRDSEGPAFFISDHPEVIMVEPADDAEVYEAGRVAITLTLSEPLDSTNQRRLSDCLHVIPGDRVAAGNQGTLDTNFLDPDEQATVAAQPFKLTDAVYSISEDSTFLADELTMAETKWNAEGDAVTLLFNAPMLTDSDDPVRYGVALFGKGEAIKDPGGNTLGTDETGGLNTTPAAGEMIYFPFQSGLLEVPAGASTAAKRWQTTHFNLFSIELPEDDTDPVLTAVSVTNPTVDGVQKTRIHLTFSEPMAAYLGGNKGIMGTIDGARQFSGDQLSAEESGVFAFAVGETAADLEDIVMEGFPAEVAAAPWGDSADERDVEFKLNAPRLSVNPDDPKTLRLEVNGNLFSDTVNAIQAYVEGISDPAGNTITESSAEQNTKIGNI